MLLDSLLTYYTLKLEDILDLYVYLQSHFFIAFKCCPREESVQHEQASDPVFFMQARTPVLKSVIFFKQTKTNRVNVIQDGKSHLKLFFRLAEADLKCHKNS